MSDIEGIIDNFIDKNIYEILTDKYEKVIETIRKSPDLYQSIIDDLVTEFAKENCNSNCEYYKKATSE